MKQITLKGTWKSNYKFRSLGDTITDTFIIRKRVSWDNNQNEGCLDISSTNLSFISEGKLGPIILNTFVPPIIACDCNYIHHSAARLFDSYDRHMQLQRRSHKVKQRRRDTLD